MPINIIKKQQNKVKPRLEAQFEETPEEYNGLWANYGIHTDGAQIGSMRYNSSKAAKKRHVAALAGPAPRLNGLSKKTHIVTIQIPVKGA